MEKSKKRVRRSNGQQASKSTSAESADNQKSIWFMETKVLQDKNFQEAIAHEQIAKQLATEKSSQQKKEDFRNFTTNYGVLVVMNKQESYSYIPLCKLLELRGKIESDDLFWAFIFMEDFLFRYGKENEYDYNYDFVSYLCDIREMLCTYPDWLDSLYIIKNANAERILQEIFDLPQVERNMVLDKYFDNPKSFSEYDKDINSGVLGKELVVNDKGILIDYVVINLLDEKEYPYVVFDATKKRQYPLTYAEFERFKELVSSGVNGEAYLEEIWFKRRQSNN
ncbi:MAG: hypothetical protein RO257_14535 [Candidatus Kapabacteria bacterium]|nr:hypothetical protein [Candidatus Kapabacteria bacterium]